MSLKKGHVSPVAKKLGSAAHAVTMTGEMVDLFEHREEGVARIAAIQGAKRTSELVPLCHPLAITRIAVDFEIDAARSEVRCSAQVETLGRTGVEMEALTAVQVGLLTIYDMCKAVDRGMVMGDIRLLEKRGGKSGDWRVDPG